MRGAGGVPNSGGSSHERNLEARTRCVSVQEAGACGEMRQRYGEFDFKRSTVGIRERGGVRVPSDMRQLDSALFCGAFWLQHDEFEPRRRVRSVKGPGYGWALCRSCDMASICAYCRSEGSVLPIHHHHPRRSALCRRRRARHTKQRDWRPISSTRRRGVRAVNGS